MDSQVQTARLLIPGLSAAAATLLLSASALAASKPVVPCEEVGRNLKSLEVPVETLNLETIDHGPIAQPTEESIAAEEDARTAAAESPIIYLTPRVTSILRDVFDSDTENPAPVMPVHPVTSPVADSEEDLAETAVAPADVVTEPQDVPHYQRQMYRKDI